jgi:hypothetical protein
MSNDAGEEVGEFVVGGDVTGVVVCLVTDIEGALDGESAGSVSGISDD